MESRGRGAGKRKDRLEVRTVSWKPELRGWQMPEGRGLRHMERGLGGGPSEGCIGRGVRAKADVSRDEQ